MSNRDTADRKKMARDWVNLTLRGLAGVNTDCPEGDMGYFLVNSPIQNPDDAWPVILEVIRICRSDFYSKGNSEIGDKVISVLGAGPLEDVVVHHGDRFIDRIIDSAKSDALFLRALKSVWTDGVPDQVFSRISHVTGTY